MARASDPAADDDPARPLRRAFVRTSPRLYARQRRLFARVRAGTVAGLEAEEAALALVAAVLGHGFGDDRAASSRRHADAHRDLALRARAELARDPASPVNLAELARRLGVSVFHLCRVFKAWTGTSLHACRLDLRLRLALERLESRHVNCSALAFEMGFSSHSHFTETFRRRLGWTPSAARAQLGPGAPVPRRLRARSARTA